jgi:hypothetical protein
MTKEIVWLAMVVFLMVSVASASLCNMQTIYVYGNVYETGSNFPVGDATVIVTCNHNGANYSRTGVSEDDGRFRIMFDKRQCDYHDAVYVHSEKWGVSGPEIKGSIEYIYPYGCSSKMNSFNPNVEPPPIVPEFGWTIGALTAVSAVGVFFIIRKR